MILVDSSAWITYYRREGSEDIKGLIIEAISADGVAINGVIAVEVLSGISRDKEFKKVDSDFKGFHWFPLVEETFSEASSLGSSLRKKGITIPSTDLIIAASAISSGSTLFHLDSHFDMIAKHTDLKVRNLLSI